eukprot:TRINITY_DN8023_c0_g1_i1.p1 TRINITY_DN8023_c0_g1~~TRINITY_DN8023_c0_g1_i1.p1  ORF type:complete len:782 (+),score=93.36 TRINITY_DN8023_c0_g1_i1:190-2535(+)
MEAIQSKLPVQLSTIQLTNTNTDSKATSSQRTSAFSLSSEVVLNAVSTSKGTEDWKADAENDEDDDDPDCTRVELWGALPAPASRGAWARDDCAVDEVFVASRQPDISWTMTPDDLSPTNSDILGWDDEGADFDDADDESAADSAPLRFHSGTRLKGLGKASVSLVGVGGGHVVFVTDVSEVFVYGLNDRGQLGTGDLFNKLKATRVPQPKAFGELRANSDSGAELGTGVDLVAGPRVVAVACGMEHTLLLVSPSGCTDQGDARVFACGAAEATGLKSQSDQAVFHMLPEPVGCRAIAARADASCCAATTSVARLENEKSARELIYIWGEVNFSGLADFIDAPKAIFRLPAPAKEVSLGGYFGVAVDVEGSVYAWGDNTYGELGTVRDALGSNAVHSEMAMHGVARSSRLSRTVATKTVASKAMPRAKTLPAAAFSEIASPMSDSAACSRIPLLKRMVWTGSPDGSVIKGNPPKDSSRRPSAAQIRGISSLNSDATRSVLPPPSVLGKSRTTPEFVDTDSPRGTLGHSLKQSFSTKSAKSTEPRQVTFDSVAAPKITSIRCGERHTVMLSSDNRLFAFGDNLSGQCGVMHSQRLSHLNGGVVSQPQAVPLDGILASMEPGQNRSNLRQGSSDSSKFRMGSAWERFDELHGEAPAASIYTGGRHSAAVTLGGNLFMWGHPGHSKLDCVGPNPDGSARGEDPYAAENPRVAGVAIRSPLKDSVRRPRLVCPLLLRKLDAVGLGDECTVIVTRGEKMAPVKDPEDHLIPTVVEEKETIDVVRSG